MQKYIKNDLSEIRYFESDISVEDWIDLAQFRLMTDDEILKQETLKPSEFHTIWDSTKGEWLDNRTTEQIAEHERSLLPKLSKRQFALQLNSVLIGDSTMYKQVLTLIAQDDIAQIEWETVSDIERLSPTVVMMSQSLGLTDTQVDEMWKEALTR